MAETTPERAADRDIPAPPRPSPVGARISVEDPPVPEEKLILPPDVKGYPTTAGIVVEKGEAITINVEPGDVVYYWNGQATEVFGAKIIGEDAVVAVERQTRHF